jgi:hypothetical protein
MQDYIEKVKIQKECGNTVEGENTDRRLEETGKGGIQREGGNKEGGGNTEEWAGGIKEGEKARIRRNRQE